MTTLHVLVGYIKHYFVAEVKKVMPYWYFYICNWILYEISKTALTVTALYVKLENANLNIHR